MTEQIFDWEDAIIRIENSLPNSEAGRSDRRGLIRVFQKCQEMGVDTMFARYACMAPISNLRTAASELKRAVRWNSREAVEDILTLAMTRNNADLRIALHTVELDNVEVTHADGRYFVELRPDQFAELQQAMKLRHRYHVRQPEPARGLRQYDTFRVYS